MKDVEKGNWFHVFHLSRLRFCDSDRTTGLQAVEFIGPRVIIIIMIEQFEFEPEQLQAMVS